MEPEDLTPVFPAEPVNLWLKIMRREFKIVRESGSRDYCYITTDELVTTDNQKALTACTRALGHIGPHVNIYGVWW